MPQTLDFPGVYIQEVPSGVRTITAVATSITAFVGEAIDGPVNQPMRIFSLGEYETSFGPAQADNALSQAVRLFFLNGGTDAYVVGIAKTGATATSGEINSGGAGVLKVSAKNTGERAKELRVLIDHDVPAKPDNLFNLTVLRETKDALGAPALVEVEKHRNLSFDSASPRFFKNYLQQNSRYVNAALLGAAPATVF